MTFRLNYHLAKPYPLTTVRRMIREYPSQYPTPKYLTFIETMIRNGWGVKVYVAKVSKYVFIKKMGMLYKIRFSNHKPIFGRQLVRDCDFYVGISHFATHTTDEIIAEIKRRESAALKDDNIKV